MALFPMCLADWTTRHYALDAIVVGITIMVLLRKTGTSEFQSTRQSVEAKASTHKLSAQ